MKSKILPLIFLLCTIPTAQQTTADLPNDLAIFHDAHHDDFTDDHDSIDGLSANLTFAGSSATSVGIEDTFEIPVNTNVALFPATDSGFTQNDLDEIQTWFSSSGSKLLWVAGDSDFGGFFNYSNIHQIFTTVGSTLRFADAEIQDATSNDGQPYRVFSTGFPTDGKINNYTSQGVSRIVTHGPTGILVHTDDGIFDPMDNDFGMIEILATSAETSIIFNGDGSTNEYDFYGDFSNSGVEGARAIVVIEQISMGKWVIASGEVIFSDYKFMYGHVSETTTDHQGDTFVDNILSWFSEYGATEVLIPPPTSSSSPDPNSDSDPIDNNPTDSDPPTLAPIPFSVFLSSCLTIVILRKFVKR